MAYEKLNSVRMKAINEKAVLSAVCKFGPISRRDLAEHTGLTSATITNLVGELIENNYLIESGQGASIGGRRPQMIEINPEAGFIIGVELNTSKIICILSDFKPNVLDKLTVDIDVSMGKDVIISEIVNAILNIIARNGIGSSKVFGVGFVSAGPYDRERGVMINPPNFPGWHNVQIRDMLTHTTGIKTYFERETPAVALGEYWFGSNNGNKRLLSVTVYEVGLGGGLVIDGEVYHGFCDGSMEIGHMVVQPDGAQCSCGSKGCLEVQADGAASVRYARELMAAGQKSALPEDSEFHMKDVIACAASGDPVARQAIDKCAHFLGMALANLSVVFSPDVIYLGGPFIEESPQLFYKTIEIIDERPYPMHLRNIKKTPFSFGEYGASMGGIAIVYSELSVV